MGLFRGLTVFVVGIFVLSMITKYKKSLKKIPIVGPFITDAVLKHKEYVIILAIAFSQVLL